MAMKTYNLRAFTGPCLVQEIAERCKGIGIKVDVIGTEHIYIQAEGQDKEHAKFNTINALVRKYNTHFWLIFR